MTFSEPLLSLFAVLAAAVLSALMTWAIRPVLLRHALATPNARSSHRIPTPQGAGIAVIAAALLVAGILTACTGTMALTIPVAVFAAALFMAVVGFAYRHLEARKRKARGSRMQLARFVWKNTQPP